MQDKSCIFQSAKHLRTYKEKLNKKDNKSSYIYVCDHPPTKLCVVLQKSSFEKNERTIWKAVESEYRYCLMCFYIDDQKIEIPQYFEIFKLC